MPSERVVWGPPGTGKTEMGTTLAREWVKQDTHPAQIAYLAFTKAAAKAAAVKIFETEDDTRMAEQFPLFRTIHSLCFMGMRKAKPDQRLISTGDMKQFGKVSSMEGTYAVFDWEDLAEVYRKMEDQGRTEWDRALAAYTLSRITCGSVEELERAKVEPSNAASMILGRENSDCYATFVRQYEIFKKADGLLDFTDMLEFGLREMRPLDDVKYVVVDEAQDLCKLHFAIIDRVFPNAREIWWIGDDDQCQPAGTKVWLSKDGSHVKDISEMVSGDKVVSFDRPGSALVSGKAILETGRREYTGRLLTVAAGGFETKATPNHRFIARWTDAARQGKACATYLMERGGLWRVGWCQLFNSEGAFHFNIRMNHERAERGWLLAVHDDRTGASVHESVLAARYGLPTVTFEPVEGANHLTRESIDAVFDGIGDRTEQAVRCLRDHGRDPSFPFVDKIGSPGRHRSTVFETQACNLVPPLMAVPVVKGGSFIWGIVSVSERTAVNVPVYSLKVEDHETYVADGIVTHNSIYEFSGASAELFLSRTKRARYQLQLRQTHRFGQGIVDFSAKVIKRVMERHPKEIVGAVGPDGSVRLDGAVRLAGEFIPTPGRTLILHRHVQGCQAVGDAYIAAGLPFRNERGRDPLGASARVKAWKALDALAKGGRVSVTQMEILADQLIKSYITNERNEIVWLMPRGAKSKLDQIAKGAMSLQELVAAKVLTEEGAGVISMREYTTLKHSEDLEYYERVVKKGYDLDEEANIPRITTIHGAKGRQAQSVVVFSEMSRRCWDNPDGEHRLAYVASTRTETDVTVCEENSVEWAISKYGYPVGDDDGRTGVPRGGPQGQIVGA